MTAEYPTTKTEYREAIAAAVAQLEDFSMLDLIYQLLKKSQDTARKEVAV